VRPGGHRLLGGKEEATTTGIFRTRTWSPIVVDRMGLRGQTRLPELPEAKKGAFGGIRDPRVDAEVLTSSKPWPNYYEPA